MTQAAMHELLTIEHSTAEALLISGPPALSQYIGRPFPTFMLIRFHRHKRTCRPSRDRPRRTAEFSPMPAEKTIASTLPLSCTR